MRQTAAHTDPELGVSMNDLFEAVTQQGPIKPNNKKEWDELYVLLSSTFSPHRPINDNDLFVGRIEIVGRIIDAVFQEGNHVVLYGDRGVGKSSLANSLKTTLPKVKSTIYCTKRSCTIEHDFGMIWRHLLDDFQIDGRPAAELIGQNPNPYDIYKILRDFPINKNMVFIIDEFDRVQDEKTKQLMSDLIKYLSDNDDRTTIIVVGVAKSIDQLFANHASLPRAMKQISMPRMRPDELEEIITTRIRQVGMSIEPDTTSAIVALSQGFPGYTHLLALNAARETVSRKSVSITNYDLQNALSIVAVEADESVTKAYHDAISSTKPQNQYKEVLLACALADTDDRGRFTAKAVSERLSGILGREVAMTSFGRNLEQFQMVDRGPALIKEGARKNYHYSFEYALLKPYVIVKGLAEGTINRSHLRL
jgi:Cdc6-like AAA superfamily ATPase